MEGGREREKGRKRELEMLEGCVSLETSRNTATTYRQCKPQLVKHIDIIHSIQRVTPTLVQVGEGVRRLQHQTLPQVTALHGTSHHLVEDVEVPLLGGLEADSREFQQVVLNDAPADLVTPVKADLNEFAKSGAVVIANRFCIPCGHTHNRTCFQCLIKMNGLCILCLQISMPNASLVHVPSHNLWKARVRGGYNSFHFVYCKRCFRLPTCKL